MQRTQLYLRGTGRAVRSRGGGVRSCKCTGSEGMPCSFSSVWGSGIRTMSLSVSGSFLGLGGGLRLLLGGGVETPQRGEGIRDRGRLCTFST